MESTTEQVDSTTTWTKLSWTYVIDKPWNIATAERLTQSGDEYYMKVYKTDQPFKVGSTTEPRTELSTKPHWNETGRYQFEADFYVPTGTNGVNIIQVFGGTTHATAGMLHIWNGELRYY